MAFERFTQAGRGFRPEMTVRKTGSLGLNRGAISKFALDNYPFVVLFFDRENHRIGLKPVTDGEEEGAVKLRIRLNNASISARSFLDFYDIPYDKTRKFSVRHSDEDDLIVAEMDSPVR